jgi:hypothetical protein
LRLPSDRADLGRDGTPTRRDRRGDARAVAIRPGGLNEGAPRGTITGFGDRAGEASAPRGCPEFCVFEPYLS